MAPTSSNHLPAPLEALLLLDAYNKRQTVAQSEQKSCLWNLHKARREKSRESLGVAEELSALHVREEVYPRAVVVEDNGMGELIDEDEEKRKESSGYLKTVWKIVDPVEREKETKQAAADAATNDKENKDHKSTGLRQRKKGDSKTTEDDKKWTTEVEDEFQAAENLIREADPIALVGGALPSRDLRTAQVNAKKALEAYIDAANFAAQLLTLLKENSSSKQPE